MAFLQERSEIERNEASFRRKVNIREKLIFPAYFKLETVHQTERNQLSYSEFKVISMVVSKKDLIDPDSGENIARKRRKLGIDGGNAAADAITFWLCILLVYM